MKALLKKLFQISLGVILSYTGILHLTSKRVDFRAQVPSWLPIDSDFVVIASGIVEIALGLSLIFLWQWRKQVGVITAIFFVLIFPGNIWQYIDGIDAFGLDTDRERLIRLFFQPVLIFWALWSTSAFPNKRNLVRR
jgi:uncharacterized membrane protein